MTATNATDPSHPPQASDLAPEISALIEAAIARAAGTTTIRRPEVRTVYWSVEEAPLRLPHLTTSKKRTRVVALRDLVFVGLYVGVLLASWVSLLIGLNKLEAAQRTTRACITQIDEPAVSRPGLERRLCDRLSQQG
jgi:hypothetical protein